MSGPLRHVACIAWLDMGLSAEERAAIDAVLTSVTDRLGRGAMRPVPTGPPDRVQRGGPTSIGPNSPGRGGMQ